MVYKWLGPFNEMYIKMKQQHQKKEEEIILLEMFDDLFGETFRSDGLGGKRNKKQKPGEKPYLSEGSHIEFQDYNERLSGEDPLEL